MSSAATPHHQALSKVAREPTRSPRVWDATFVWSLLWGVVLAWLVTRHLFAPGSGEFVDNHDSDGYGRRIVEFRECLRQGYLFPQWCSDFRGGLGSPYFSYYQPLFFYVGSLCPTNWPIARQVAVTTFAFTVVGYLGMFRLVRHHVGAPGAFLAATLFLTAPYVYSELYLRGDFSEFAAMMLAPCFLHGLLAFVERPSTSAGWWGALGGAALVTAHPAVALASFGLVAALLVAWSVRHKDRDVLTRGTALCAAAAGLAAVYWVPVFADTRFVSADEAWKGQIFDGYYHYSKHFIPWSWMVGRQVTPTPIPVKLGLIHGIAGVVGLVVGVVRWKHWTVAQRRALTFGAGLLWASLFLMSPWSEFLWRHLPLLERIQFPWRLFSLVFLAIAVVAGYGVAGIQRPIAQVAVVSILGLAAVAVSFGRPAPGIVNIREPRSAAELADSFFAPDIANEWLPRGARVLKVSVARRRPLHAPEVVTRDYHFDVTGLRCHVATRDPAPVVLPHYYFPVGWIATLDGKPVVLQPDPAGLMRVELPANASGLLEIRWRTTASKWIGMAITAASFLGLAGLLAWLRRRRSGPSQGTTRQPRAGEVASAAAR